MSEDRSWDKQELELIVILVPSLCISKCFFQAFFLPPWRSFLKSHWKCDESQVQELTLFYSPLFSADISETIKTQLSRTMKETISFPITDATEGNTRSGFRKSSHTWKEMALRLFNSRRNLQCMWQKCLMSICMNVHMSVYICVDTCCCCKSLQLCLTLCNPIDGSPPGSSVPGILQARRLEWVAISFSM